MQNPGAGSCHMGSVVGQEIGEPAVGFHLIKQPRHLQRDRRNFYDEEPAESLKGDTVRRGLDFKMVSDVQHKKSHAFQKFNGLRGQS